MFKRRLAHNAALALTILSAAVTFCMGVVLIFGLLGLVTGEFGLLDLAGTAGIAAAALLMTAVCWTIAETTEGEDHE